MTSLQAGALNRNQWNPAWNPLSRKKYTGCTWSGESAAGGFFLPEECKVKSMQNRIVSVAPGFTILMSSTLSAMLGPQKSHIPTMSDGIKRMVMIFWVSHFGRPVKMA